MKKRVACFTVAFMMLLSGLPASASDVTIFAPDGRTAMVPAAEVPVYLSVGWYASYDETVKTIFAPDGRTARVFLADVPAYLSAGWFESHEETVTTLYAPDGRQTSVYLSEVQAYMALGWYESYAETVQVLYAPGDRTVTVYKSEVPSYVALGWSTTPVSGPVVALTFDDGPHGVHTNAVMDTLAAYGAKGTFFMLGSQAAAYPSLVQRARSLGFEVGSHSYSHPNLKNLSAAGIQKELNSTAKVIQNASGAAPTVFRPPYGNYNDTVRSAAGVPVIIWNVDPQDWKSRNAEAVARHVLSYATDGDIILMHDIYGSTAEAVKIIVPALLERGFRLVTVSELLREKGVDAYAGSVHHGF